MASRHFHRQGKSVSKPVIARATAMQSIMLSKLQEE